MKRDMWKPPFRVKRYANDKYKFLVRGKVDGKWKRRYFETESEAVAFAEQQNAAAERTIPEPFQENGAPPPPPAPVFAPPERHPRLQLSRGLDFADLTTPVYLGPRIERYLGDSWCMHLPFAYDLMRELAPKVFVELGVKQGESYFAFCQSAAENKISVRCYGVDSWRGDVQTGNLDPEIEHEVARYNWRYSSFSELKVMLFEEALGEFADGSIDLLHIDGTHTYSDVRTDFESWLPKLSPNGVILFHDVAVRDGGFGVWKVWEEISGKNNSFLFEFGHGLGIWKKERVTPDDPPFLRKLMTASVAESRDINLFYTNAAAALALWHDLHKQPEAELARLRQQTDEKENQITELERQVADSRTQIVQLQLEGAEKARQNAELAKAQAELGKDRAELAHNLAEFQRTAEAKSAEVRELSQRMEKLGAEANQLREVASQIPVLQRENDKQIQLVETLRSQVERKEERLAQASKDLMDAQWEALTMRATVLRKSELPDAASSGLLDLENRAEVAESDREHLRGMVIGLQKDLEQAQHSRQSSLEDLRVAEEELKRSQDELKRSTEQLRLHKEQMSRLRRDISGKLILPFGRSQERIQQLTAVTRTDD